MSKAFRYLSIVVAVLALAALVAGCGAQGSTPTRVPEQVMYFCGYDRCRASGEYGKLTFKTGISVWNGPEPNRGGRHHTVSHGHRVTVVETKRATAGSGGLWFRLKEGGWTNDLWLTESPCTPDNLEQYSLPDC